MSVLDIQRKVALSRPTLYRLLQTLIAKGLPNVLALADEVIE
jgi:DNA-binding IclR family transcriptional regulator